jgi:flagellar motility protein MotE (MotC chaperone)
VQDKAALLANMEPGAVARLLGLMEPNEAAVLLAALGDGNARLVSQALSSEERDRMVEVGACSLCCCCCCCLALDVGGCLAI